MKLGSALVVLVLVLVACGGGGGGATSPGATTGARSPQATTAGATSTATEEPTETEEPAESAAASPDESEPAGSPGESPAESPGESPAGSPGVTPGPSAPAAVEGTLTLWVDETRAPIMIDVGEEFEAATGVPVDVHQLGFGDIRDQLQLRGPAGEGPDIIIGAHDWLGQLAENGLVEPLDLGAATENIDPVALEAFTYDGTLYGLPYASEAVALYYNTELVPEAPATWDELKAAATELQETGGLEQAFIIPEKDPYHTYPFLTGHGGYIFGETETGYDPTDVGLDTEGGLAYATELGAMVEAGLLRPGVNYDAMIASFNAGDAAMFITGPWALNQIREGGQPFAVAPIPTMLEEPRPFVGVQGFMVSADAPNSTLAQTFLTEYLATDEVMGNLFEADPRPSTWTPVATTIDDPEVLAFIESASNGDPLPAIPEMSAVWTDWTDALDLIFTGAQAPEDAISDAAESIRGIIGGSASPSP
jgi:maltose-binding protein MalE